MQKKHNKYDRYYPTFIQNYVENDNKLTLNSYEFNTQINTVIEWRIKINGKKSSEGFSWPKKKLWNRMLK